MAKQKIVENVPRDLVLGEVVLTGGGALLPNIEAIAEDVFGLPVRVGMPNTIGGLTDAMALPQYATAIGLVLFGANDERDAADHRPPARRIVRSSRHEMVVGFMELEPKRPRRKRAAGAPAPAAPAETLADAVRLQRNCGNPPDVPVADAPVDANPRAPRDPPSLRRNSPPEKPFPSRAPPARRRTCSEAAPQRTLFPRRNRKEEWLRPDAPLPSPNTPRRSK